MEAGATAVIQPGGSIRDAEVIAAADEAGIAMAFTGVRVFRHEKGHNPLFPPQAGTQAFYRRAQLPARKPRPPLLAGESGVYGSSPAMAPRPRNG